MVLIPIVGSIESARKRSTQQGLDQRITFGVVSSEDYPSASAYDLVTFFDCLRDMGDPVGAARAAHHVLQTLQPDGVWMIVEPFAGDSPEQKHNPIGRIKYSPSTFAPRRLWPRKLDWERRPANAASAKSLWPAGLRASGEQAKRFQPGL